MWHVLLVAIMLTGKAARAGDRPKSCWEHAMTQLEMNHCAAEDGSKADDELNDVYRRIMKEYSDDPAFVTAMKNAQRAWLKFRDAEIAALFPHQRAAGNYGSVAPMCQAMWQDSLTRDRTRQTSPMAQRNDRSRRVQRVNQAFQGPPE